MTYKNTTMPFYFEFKFTPATKNNPHSLLIRLLTSLNKNLCCRFTYKKYYGHGRNERKWGRCNPRSND
jgi:hypothetical protein